MSPKDRPDINMSGIPVAGVGGLGLVAVSLVMTIYYPQAWWLLIIGATGGVVVGAVLVVYRRHHREAGPSGDDPTILFRPEAADDRRPARPAAAPRHDVEPLIAGGIAR